MVSDIHRDVLSQIYFTPSHPNSYGSIETLYIHAKAKDKSITRKIVREFLSAQSAYTLHRQTFKRFCRRKVFSSRPKLIASMDLADMTLLQKDNNGYKYLLIVIDIFSRFLQVVPLKRKDGETVLTGLKSILESPNFEGIRKLNSDLGKEFYNKHVNTYLTKNGIVLYSVHSREIKASIAERVIRTLKQKLYKYMSYSNSRKYIDVLDSIVDSYNNSAHRGLKEGQTPVQIHQLTDYDQIKAQFDRMYKEEMKAKTSLTQPLAVGQPVRLADSERNYIFRKGYSIQNTLEIFKVKRVDRTYHPTVYYLEDLEEEKIDGVFYREELIPCKIPTEFPIDVIKTRKVNGKKKFLVRWIGYPDKTISWVDEDDIESI